MFYEIMHIRGGAKENDNKFPKKNSNEVFTNKNQNFAI